VGHPAERIDISLLHESIVVISSTGFKKTNRALYGYSFIYRSTGVSLLISMGQALLFLRPQKRSLSNDN
jgi:hypothetical protein